MARKQKGDDRAAGGKPHVAARIPAELLAKIDALMQELSTEWMKVTRSVVLRMLLRKGIAVFKRERAEVKKIEVEEAEAKKTEAEVEKPEE